MRLLLYILLSISLFQELHAQTSYEVTFTHDGKIVYGTFTVPFAGGKFPAVIINPGSGPNDRDGTLPMVGANISCLYPGLLGDTLRPYKELSDKLVEAGYAVLRYDKLEFTYPGTLGAITFHKLWLPVESAINYVKTRSDVDTNAIILLGHSEGSTIIPFIAKGRNDIKALISVAGARTPFDTLFANQIVDLARMCNGDTALAKLQAHQIRTYFNTIRTNNWNQNTPPLFGVPASIWYDYVLATDPVAENYNMVNLPTLFIGLGLDFNVPPAELLRFQQEVTITDDFWSIPGVNHFMTTNDEPHISMVLTDTIIFWLSRVMTTGMNDHGYDDQPIEVYPNPFIHEFDIIPEIRTEVSSFSVINIQGDTVLTKVISNSNDLLSINLRSAPAGVYFVIVRTKGKAIVSKVIKG